MTRVSLNTSRSPGRSRRGDVGEAAVVQAALRIQVQQAAAAALRAGVLGDELRRQFVVEVGDAMGRGDGRGHARNGNREKREIVKNQPAIVVGPPHGLDLAVYPWRFWRSGDASGRGMIEQWGVRMAGIGRRLVAGLLACP